MRNKIAGSLLAVTLSFIGINEGLKLSAYQDTGGVWTICNGITKGVAEGHTATLKECEAKLAEELAVHIVPLQKLPHELPPGVLVAWADFCFNVGVGACERSTGYRYLKAGEFSQACDQLLRWKYTTVNGKKRDCSRPGSGCAGIWTRRLLEHRVCTENKPQ